MADQCSLPAALAVCAAAGVAALCASASLAQQPAPAHRELGNLVLESVPLPDAALMARLERYQQSRQATFLDWLADGGLLVATRFGDSEQLHRVAAPLGMREQLTFYQDPIEWARAPRGGSGFVFLKDQGGDENAQVYYHGGGGDVRQLTHGAFIHGSPVWAHDGRRVAFYGNDRDSLSYDVYVADVTSGAAPQLLVGGHQDTWYPLDWSADDRQLLVWKYVSISESYLYLADVATGTLTALEDSPRKVGIRMAKFAPDGRSVYVLTDEDGELVQLKLKDPVTHQSRSVTPAAGWDVADFDVSGDGRYVAYVVDDDGRSRLTVLDTQAKLELAPVGLPEGRIGNLRFDRSGRRLALSAESALAPRDVYVYDLEHGKLERWTRSEPGPLDPSTLTTPELIHYPTWDRTGVGRHARMLSAYLYRPRTAAPCPVVIDIHGGPESQYRPGWDPFVQFLVNELGYAVVAPNVRGSSGYGKSFLAPDNGVLREDAKRIRKPLLVVAGANDPRVPVSESEQLVWSVRAAGGEVWYLLAKDEGHGFRKKANRDVYLQTAASFLQRLAH